MTNITITKGSETFTFAEGMVDGISSTISTEIEQNVLPISGPMNNLGVDINGSIKIIVVSGNLSDQATTVSNTQNIRSKKVMKLWLEALQDGNQAALTFTSNYEDYSVLGAGTYVVTDSVSSASITIPASFSATKVYSTNIAFDDEAGNPNLIPYTLTLWVAGS